MHQSFVTIAPPPTHLRGIAGQRLFIRHSPAKSPALRGPAESHSPALYHSKFHGGIFAKCHKPSTYPALGTRKVTTPHISLVIPPPPPSRRWGCGGNKWLVYNRTSTPSTFVAEKINVLRCYRYPMGTGSLHYSFLSFFISSNE